MAKMFKEKEIEKVENKIKWRLMQNNPRLNDGQKFKSEC